MKVFKQAQPVKLCHLKPGDCMRVLRPVRPSGNRVSEELFVVCRFTEKARTPVKSTTGLYSEENPLFMVSLESGEAYPLPHLSSMVVRVDDVYVVVASEVIGCGVEE